MRTIKVFQQTIYKILWTHLFYFGQTDNYDNYDNLKIVVVVVVLVWLLMIRTCIMKVFA